MFTSRKNRIVPSGHDVDLINQANTAQIAALKREVEANVTHIAHLELNIKAVKSENIHLREAIEGKNSQINRLKQTAASLQETVEIMDAEIVQIKQGTAFAGLEQELTFKITEIHCLHQAIEIQAKTISTEIARITAELTDTKNTLKLRDGEIGIQKAEIADLQMKMSDEFKTTQNSAFALVLQMAELKIQGLEEELKKTTHVAPCSWCQKNKDTTVYNFVAQTCGCAVCHECIIERGPTTHTGPCKTCEKYASSVGKFRFVYK
jgi:chromosome segregation ATPase